MHTIEQTLRTFVIENFLFGQGSDIENDASFLKTGIIDSTGVIELVSFLEEQYGITIHDEEVIPENLDSITNLKRFLARKLNQAATSSNVA